MMHSHEPPMSSRIAIGGYVHLVNRGGLVDLQQVKLKILDAASVQTCIQYKNIVHLIRQSYSYIVLGESSYKVIVEIKTHSLCRIRGPLNAWPKLESGNIVRRPYTCF